LGPESKFFRVIEAILLLSLLAQGKVSDLYRVG